MNAEEVARELRMMELLVEARWSALELILAEALVGLEASGALTRQEIAQTLLRAQTRANIPDEDEQPSFVRETRASYIEWITESASRRLGAAPELGLLRREIAKWEEGGRRGRHPCEPARRRRGL